MIRNQLDNLDARQSAEILLSLSPDGKSIPCCTRDDTSKRNEVSVDRSQLPLTIHFGDKTYILVVTRSNKLLLQKPF